MVEYGKAPEPSRASAVSRSYVGAMPAGDESDRALAVAWARSTGLVAVPDKPHKFNPWICFALAWLWIIPAFAYYFWCEATAKAYNTAMSDALRLWKTHGSPDPYALKTAAKETQSVQIEQVQQPSLSEKLQELAELRERGLLSEEEFAAAKKKLLDI